MSPPPQRQAVIVGVFTTIAIAILIGGILTIGDLNDTFTRKVQVSAVFDEVGGLQRGDNIWFSGVKVGVVTELRFQGDAQVVVEMKVDEAATEFIARDCQARVSSDGLIGSRIVVLYGGSAEAPRLEEGDELEVGVALSTDDIMRVFQENNENLLAITTDLKGISGDLAKGRGTLGRLLEDELMSTQVAETVTSLSLASEEARTMGASMSSFAGKLNREGTLPGDLVNDTTSYAALTRTVTSLEQAGARASTMVDGLATAVDDPLSPLGTLLRDRAAGADLKQTLEQVNQGSALLSEDLEALQHTFPLKGYFRRQARKAEKAEKAEKSKKSDETP